MANSNLLLATLRFLSLRNLLFNSNNLFFQGKRQEHQDTLKDLLCLQGKQYQLKMGPILMKQTKGSNLKELIIKEDAIIIAIYWEIFLTSSFMMILYLRLKMDYCMGAI